MWFKKKRFLKEALSGAVDIHNHILPSIDDGSKDIAMTIEMLELFKALGFKRVIATPHTMVDYYGNTVKGITDSFNETKTQLSQNDNSRMLQAAASEYMMDDGFEKLLDNGDLLFLKGKTLLVEFSYFQKPHNYHDLVFKMRQKEIIPILAHPERYRYINGIEEFKKLKDMGFDFQLNLLSLVGHYGKDAFAKAKLLLLNDFYDYVGTDAHKPEHLDILMTAKVEEKVFDSLATLIENNEEFYKAL